MTLYAANYHPVWQLLIHCWGNILPQLRHALQPLPPPCCIPIMHWPLQYADLPGAEDHEAQLHKGIQLLSLGHACALE